MKKSIIIKSLIVSFAAFIVVAVVAYAASTIDITTLLNGQEGDTFNLAGNLQADKVFVDGNLRVSGQLKGSAFKAKNIKYINNELGVTNVKGALDALALAASNLSLQQALQEGITSQNTSQRTTQALSGSTWNVTVYDVWENSLRTTTEIDGTPITVTFTPTTETEGTFSSTPLNIFYPYEQIAQELHIDTITGNYTIVGDTILVTDVSSTDLTSGLTAEMTVLDDNSIIFEETRVTPNAVIVLTP